MRVAVVNLKGGTGKTTTAVHIAAALARNGRTLLVDADPQGSTLSWSENAEEFPCPTIGLPVRDLDRRLRDLATDYEHTVIDTPPADAAIARGALLAADAAVIPIPPSLMDLDRLRPTLELIAAVEPVNPELTFTALLTRVRHATRSARAARELLVELGVPVLDTEIPLREAFATAFGDNPDGGHEYATVVHELGADS